MDYNQIGRAVIRLYYHARTLPPSLETVVLGTTIKAGRFMDFAERIRRRGSELSHDQITTFARLVGLDESDLRLVALPTLKRAGVLDYSITGGQISIDEYVGVSAPLLNQVASTWEALRPSVTERCALESIELATAAPVLATWIIRSEKGIKYWEKTSIVSGKVNKQLTISSCLNQFIKQMERGDKNSFSRAYFPNG